MRNSGPQVSQAALARAVKRTKYRSEFVSYFFTRPLYQRALWDLSSYSIEIQRPAKAARVGLFDMDKHPRPGQRREGSQEQVDYRHAS